MDYIRCYSIIILLYSGVTIVFLMKRLKPMFKTMLLVIVGIVLFNLIGG